MSQILKESDLENAAQSLTILQQTLEKQLYGQELLITNAIISFFAKGHLLIEGLPGLGKTTLASQLAQQLQISFKRIQCTPDLLPADITGSEFAQAHRHELEFRPGPIFGHFVLVDEINRTTPKSQSAFLEAMQEQQVTCNGVTYPLESPFFLVATQNPIELEGTFPLPEAQLDRFLMKTLVTMPDATHLLEMVDAQFCEPREPCSALFDAEKLKRIFDLVAHIFIPQALKKAAVNIVLATHAEHKLAHPMAKQAIQHGVSPRGVTGLLKAAQVVALMANRPQACWEDLQLVALACLRHRIILNLDSRINGKSADDVLSVIIATTLEQCQKI